MKKCRRLVKQIRIFVTVFVLFFGLFFSAPIECKAESSSGDFFSWDGSGAVGDSWSFTLVSGVSISAGKTYTGTKTFSFADYVSGLSDFMVAGRSYRVYLKVSRGFSGVSNVSNLSTSVSVIGGSDPIPITTSLVDGDYSVVEISNFTGNLGIVVNYSFKNNSSSAKTVNLRSSFYSFDYRDYAHSFLLVEDITALSDSDHLANIDNQTKETVKQLDNLTNGFENDSMASSSDSLDSSLSGMGAAEDNLFSPAQSNLQSYEFVDVSAHVGIISAASFVSTFLQSFFVSSGGLDGLGIIVAVGFSVMLVSIVIGIYRHYK